MLMATLGDMGIGFGSIQRRKRSSGVRLRRSVDGKATLIAISVVGLLLGIVVARLSGMRLLTIISDGVALDIARSVGNVAVGRSHGRIVCVRAWSALVALVRQFLLEDLQPALSRGFGAIEAR